MSVCCCIVVLHLGLDRGWTQLAGRLRAELGVDGPSAINKKFEVSG